MSHYKLMINRHEHTVVRGDRAPSREITPSAGPALAHNKEYLTCCLAQPLPLFPIFLPIPAFECFVSRKGIYQILCD